MEGYTIAATPRTRTPGEKVEITVFADNNANIPEGLANEEFFANNPQIVRTANRLVLSYGVQLISKLRAITTGSPLPCSIGLTPTTADSIGVWWISRRPLVRCWIPPTVRRCAMVAWRRSILPSRTTRPTA